MNKSKIALIALLSAVGIGTTALTVSNSLLLASLFNGNTVFQTGPKNMSQDQVCSVLKTRLDRQPSNTYAYKLFKDDYNRNCKESAVTSTHNSAPEKTTSEHPTVIKKGMNNNATLKTNPKYTYPSMLKNAPTGTVKK